jgi:hypothetical protein
MTEIEITSERPVKFYQHTRRKNPEGSYLFIVDCLLFLRRKLFAIHQDVLKIFKFLGGIEE